MADATPPAPGAPAPPPRPGSPLAGVVIPVVLILAAGVVFAVFYFLNQKPPAVDQAKLLNGYLVDADRFSALDATRYRDDNGDLIADTPADAKEPAELFFCEIPGGDPNKDEATWKGFLEHMKTATGKECKYLKKVKQVDPPPGFAPPPRPGEEPEAEPDVGTVSSFGSQLKALADGQLHVTAFTTGQVRQAVNTAGFRPLVVPATADNKFTYQVKVLVPANSPAKSVADLRGKKVAVPALSSNSGAKAPFVAFHDEFKLAPAKDYTLVLTGRVEPALGKLVKGEVDAVCVASDLLARQLARTDEPTEDEKTRGWVRLTEDKFKVLHTFGEYPKLCFGVSHALPEALAKKIQAGFESFPFAGTEVGKKYAADGAVKFLPVDYKKDWQSVRDVDDRLVQVVRGK